MDQITALTVLALIYAFASILATKTKARVSMMFICSITFIALFWIGLPRTIFADSGMLPLSTTFIAMLLVQMGSILDARRLKEEWKTVLVAFLGMCAGSAGILLIAAPFISWEYALTATGPVSGGVVAALIMNEAASAKGLTAIAVFVTLLLTVQGLVGVPVASNCLIAEGKRLKALFAAGERLEGASDEEGSSRKKLIPPMPATWRNDYVYISKAFVVAWLSTKAAALTNGIVHPLVMALIFGIIFHELGFIETNVLTHGGAGGFIMFGIMIPIFMNLAKATPGMILDLIKPLFIVFASALVGITIVSFVLSKVFKYSWALSMALGCTCLFGFPGTMVISEEVATHLSESPEERDFILGHILPKMLIAGFTTVTIASVFLAGFLVKFF